MIQGPVRERTLRLRDRRRLGIAEFGDVDGKLVYWFHGTPGARRQVPPPARAFAGENGIRLVGVERPGIGASSRHLYESIRHFAHDIEEITEQLGAEQFGVMGLSGGGPYVLACAHAMPERVVAGAVFGGVAPTCGPEAAAGGPIVLASYLQPLIERLHQPLGATLSAAIRALHPIADPVFDLYARLSSDSDRRVLHDPPMRAMFVDDLLLGSRAGLHSLLYDLLLFSKPWGFSLKEIQVPIRFWQGDADHLVPFSHGAHQAALVPRAELVRVPDEGHLAGFYGAEDALRFVLSRWPSEIREISEAEL